jgi:folate-dependent phosphoribosylglycinamide formyltransferase PurN
MRVGFLCTLSELQNESVGQEFFDPISKEHRRRVPAYLQLDNSGCLVVTIVFSDGYDHIESMKHDHHIFPESFHNKIKVIPSGSWRSVPITQEKGPQRVLDLQRKKLLKDHYEQTILEHMIESQVDIIVSYSYIHIIGSKLLSAFPNRILNIHPAISDPGNPCRLPGLTPTRDAFTRAKYGFVIVDDKHCTSVPGDPVDVHFEGQIRKAVFIDEKYRFTHGITVHEVTPLVDQGTPIAEIQYDLRDYFSFNGSFSLELFSQESIRQINYHFMPEVLESALARISPKQS